MPEPQGTYVMHNHADLIVKSTFDSDHMHIRCIVWNGSY